ncbi:MAG: type II secretion system protein GspN [Pseudomonadota bacterium]
MRVIRTIFSWRAILFLAYALLLIGFLLYLRFPAQKFKQFCENRLELIFTECVCTIDRISYQIPLTFTFYGVRLRRADAAGRADFIIDSLTLTPNPAKLPNKITLAATLYGGVLSAQFDGDFSAKKMMLHDIQLSGLDVAALQKSFAVFERKIEGTLGFTGSYQATFDRPAGGTGQGRIVVDTGSMALLQPVLSLQQIDFHQAICNLQYNNGKLEASDGRLKGKDITADFTGELQPAMSFWDSELQLTGRLVPLDAFLEMHPQEQKIVQGVMKRFNMTTLPFKVGGTLNSPTFRFSR